MHFCSNNLSTIALILPLILLEVLPACISCSSNFNLSQSSSGSDYENIISEKPEAMIAGDFNNF